MQVAKQETGLSGRVRALIPLLVDAKAAEIADMVGPSGKIEDHKFGTVSGAQEARKFVADFHEWLGEWSLEEVVHLRTTEGAKRSVSEDILMMTSKSGERVQWPLATFATETPDGRGTEFFLYYTIWPLIKKHTKRKVVFSEPEIDMQPSQVLQDYHRCLTTGDLVGLANVLAPDIYIRESSGPPYVHAFFDNVVGYFKGLFADGAPMMRTERLTSDGRRTWIEFSVIGWNGEPWPEADHQAGAGVWELNDDGKMIGIRVYDDIEF